MSQHAVCFKVNRKPGHVTAHLWAGPDRLVKRCFQWRPGVWHHHSNSSDLAFGLVSPFATGGRGSAQNVQALFQFRASLCRLKPPTGTALVQPRGGGLASTAECPVNYGTGWPSLTACESLSASPCHTLIMDVLLGVEAMVWTPHVQGPLYAVYPCDKLRPTPAHWDSRPLSPALCCNPPSPRHVQESHRLTGIHLAYKRPKCGVSASCFTTRPPPGVNENTLLLLWINVYVTHPQPPAHLRLFLVSFCVFIFFLAKFIWAGGVNCHGDITCDIKIGARR